MIAITEIKYSDYTVRVGDDVNVIRNPRYIRDIDFWEISGLEKIMARIPGSVVIFAGGKYRTAPASAFKA